MSDLHTEARLRKALHKDCPNTLVLNPAHEIIGVIAERGWSALTGTLPVRDTLETGSGGDGGYDFRHEVWGADLTPWALAVDVKGSPAHRATCLMIPQGRVKPGVVYVLALVDVPGEQVVAWAGWATAREVLAREARAWPRPEVMTHSVPIADLRPIKTLLDRLI